MNLNDQKNSRPDSKNFILAIVLSTAIIFGWQYFYGFPQQAAETVVQQQAGVVVPGAPAASVVIPREQALAVSGRVKIETAELSGSINLTGAFFDDLRLKNHFEKAGRQGANVTLLSPNGTANAYFIDQGYLPTSGSTTKLPDAKSVWTVAGNAELTEKTPVKLAWDNGAGVVFTREISVSDEFLFNVKHGVENRSSSAISVLPYAGVQRQDTPYTEGYYVFFEGLLGVQDGKLTELYYSDVVEAPEGKVTKPSTGGWLGFTDKYWATALVPDQSRALNNFYQYFKLGTRDAYQLGWVAKDALTVAAGTSAGHDDKVFAGAKIVYTIEAIGEKNKIDKFNLMIDWGWFSMLTQPMFKLLHWAKGIMGSFGLAILLVTVLVKLVLFPLANKSYASMSKMKKLQPEMERIKSENPDDKVKQQQAMMELYKKEKVSPLSGCLPIVIQIPIFFALYKVILTTIDVRHAPFYGWINDLSVPDPTSLFNLFGLLPFELPQILMIGVWPILMGITMWVQMRLNPAPADPIQASMFNWMPLIFTFMLASMPAGLVIYWTWSNLLSILQQSYIMKKHGADVNVLGNIRDSLPFLKKKQV